MTDLEWEKQKEAAKTAPILDVANMTGLTIIKRGRYYTSKEHDSLVIDTKKNFFYHNSQHVNGDTIAMLPQVVNRKRCFKHRVSLAQNSG